MLVSSVILLEGEGTWGQWRHGQDRAGTASPMEVAYVDLGALSLLFPLRAECSRLVALTGKPRSGPWRPADWMPEPSTVPAAVSTEHTPPGRLWTGCDVLMVAGCYRAQSGHRSRWEMAQPLGHRDLGSHHCLHSSVRKSLRL